MQIHGRLAPSPTGYLHLGNAWSFLLAWLFARSNNGLLTLRIEDIDPERSKPEFIRAILEDLSWLGLDWDYGPGGSAPGRQEFYLQSARHAVYEAALDKLAVKKLTYPCFCSRRELRSLANAPHIGDAGVFYPGTCRRLSKDEAGARLAAGRAHAIRLIAPEGESVFDDLLRGEVRFPASELGGDFALRRSDGVFAYQLACAVDDGEMGINQIVRGRDLLSSTPRQLYLGALLGYPAAQYAHVPLLLDGQGERLAKRHQSLALRTLRERGARPGAVIGYLGFLAGINPSGADRMPRELLPAFAPHRLPRQDLQIDAGRLA